MTEGPGDHCSRAAAKAEPVRLGVAEPFISFKQDYFSPNDRREPWGPGAGRGKSEVCRGWFLEIGVRALDFRRALSRAACRAPRGRKS
jgi:hypothetical protein